MVVVVFHADVHGVRIAEEVVHIAQYLLIGTHEEHAQIIRFVFLQRMYGQTVRDVTVGNKVGNFAIRVARNVLYGAIACRALVQALQRDDGEQLVDGPRVGQRLEEREVAEILVGQQFIKALQFIWTMFHLLGQVVHLAAYAPVHTFNLGTCAQVDNAVREEVERLLTYLLSVVPVFQHGALVQVVPNLVKVFHQLVVGVVGFKLFAHFGQRGCFEHVDNEHRVVCRQRASALSDEVWMRNIVFISGIDEGIDTVVHILLYRIVDRALAVRRACAVIVDTQSATAVNKVDIVTHLMQLHIELCCLAQGRLYTAYLSDLAAYMEVNEAKRVVQSFGIKNRKSLQQFAGGKSKLRGIAPTLLPLAASARCQFDADAEVWLYAEFLGCTGNDVELVQFLNHNKDAFAHLLCQQCQLNVALVFVAVAHDDRVALALHSDNGVQFGL